MGIKSLFITALLAVALFSCMRTVKKEPPLSNQPNERRVPKSLTLAREQARQILLGHSWSLGCNVSKLLG